MRQFESDRYIVLRDNGVTAVALCAQYAEGSRAELEIQVYRDGHRKEAVDVCVHGGKLPVAARASSAAMLFTLLRRVMQRWKNLTLTFDCPDQRRVRIYAAMLDRSGLRYSQDGLFFELA